MTENCIFCKIIEGTIPSHKIYEDENCLAFLDINPFTTGHSIVIPKKHYKSIIEMPEEDIYNFFSTLKTVANKLKEKLNPKGLNILSNIGKAAGQEIMHMHFHLIPRYDDDTFGKINPPKLKITQEELKELSQLINN